MQFAKRVGILNRHFRSKLSTAAAGPELLAARATVHVTAAFEFDEISAVAENDTFVEQSGNRFHELTSFGVHASACLRHNSLPSCFMKRFMRGFFRVRFFIRKGDDRRKRDADACELARTDFLAEKENCNRHAHDGIKSTQRRDD